MFKQNSKIAILGARFFYYVKLIFDSKHQWLQENQVDQNGKTANLSQNCPKTATRNFCNFDRRRFKQKRL